MTEILIFLATAVAWCTAWYFYTKKLTIKSLALITLFCIPFDFNGHKITIFGNGSSDKTFTSIASFYQNAKGDANSLISAGYKKSEIGTTRAIINFLSYQEAVNGSFSLLNVFTQKTVRALPDSSQNQNMINGISLLSKNISIYGESGSFINIFGSEEGKTSANALIGLFSVHKTEAEAMNIFGISSRIEAKKISRVFAPSIIQIEDGKKTFFAVY